MKAIAKAKMIRTSPRKVSLVAALVRGQSVAQAKLTLAQTNKAATVTIGKVLDSAVANAENNLNLKSRDLVVESVLVGAGPTLKRIRRRSRGQANRVLKRTSHITVILNDSGAAETETKPKAPIAAKTAAKPSRTAKTNVKPAEAK